MTSSTPAPLPTATVEIRDQAILTTCRERAIAAGRTDWRVWAAEQALEGLKARLGLTADLTVREAAIYLNCHRNSIWNYHGRGMLPGLYYVSAKKAMIPVKDLDAIRNSAARTAA